MLTVIGDPLYSSLAHLVRALRLFDLCKRLDPGARALLLCYEDGAAGGAVEALVAKALNAGTLDGVLRVPVPAGGYFDLNRAATLAGYVRERKGALLAEVRAKAALVREAASGAAPVLAISSPGFLGGWHLPPLVPRNVTNALVLDTAFHPDAELLAGTAWASSGPAGRLQAALLERRLYGPFLQVLGEVRAELGLPAAPTRRELYALPVLDPNVPSYARLSRPAPGHVAIGPLTWGEGTAPDRLVDELRRLKGDGRLAYLTLGGSARDGRFAGWLREVVARVAAAVPDARFLVTCGPVVPAADVEAALGEFSPRCLVRAFADAEAAMRVADVAAGVMGQGHLMLAARHACPAVLCPVNVDQATHAALARKLGIGGSPIAARPWDLVASGKLVARTLAAGPAVAREIARVLRSPRPPGDPRLRAELEACDDAGQAAALARLLAHCGITVPAGAPEPALAGGIR